MCEIVMMTMENSVVSAGAEIPPFCSLHSRKYMDDFRIYNKFKI